MRHALVLVLFAVACSTPQPKPTPAPEQRPTPAPAPAEAAPKPPLARKLPHPTTVQGVTLQDDFAWLRNKDTPEVVDYLKAENAYTQAALAPLEPLREKLYGELLARLQEDDETPPAREGNWWYLSRSVKGKQYPVQLRRQGSPGAPDQVLLDLNQLAEGKKFLSLGAWKVSDDGNQLAYAIDETGFRQYQLRTKDLTTGKEGPERIARVTSLAWAADNKTLFYVEEDEVSKRSHQLFRHTLGSTGKDELIAEEKDERFNLGVDRSRDLEMVFVYSHSHTQSEQSWLPARAPLVPPKLIEPRAKDLEYDCDHRGGELWCRTNASGRNFKIVRAKVGTPGLPKWPEVAPHRPGVMVEELDLFRDFAVLSERDSGLQQLRILDLRQKDPFAGSHRIEMPEPAYTARPSANHQFDAASFRFVYQSPITPNSWFDYDPRTKARTLVKETPVPGLDRSRYQVERFSTTAADGAKIPVTLVTRKGALRDGTAALHLTGYGSYGLSFNAGFNAAALTGVDHGLALAIAHIRGGGDLGKEWHDDGRMLRKRNTFTDFIAVADDLVAKKIASRERLVISGGSAGGLLIGATINLRPDLCRAAYLAVPFVDVINTMLDKSLPLTVSEFEEWGNPGDSKEQFDYMLSYSPYDNLKDIRYPSVLVRSSYNDSQVMYWEPAKYVAKMRAIRHDSGEVLMQMNMDPAGHGGSSGRYDRLRERAFELSWMLQQTGLSQ